ncbi:MAG: toll/interleukin-1 receptor domain-containing protein, partial [Chitinophagaceae bacterium]|nr:toll/interleukin-1 receptor domain-containing protein [Chitinophagaceae bacterium]
MSVRNKLLNDKSSSRKNIFISYREKDTAGETGRLVDTLEDHFHEEQIFIDIEKIEPGTDFTEAISRSLEA